MAATPPHDASSKPRRVVVLATAALLTAGSAAPGSSAGGSAVEPEDRFPTAAELLATPPPGPNPYLAFLPADAEPDWEHWRARMAAMGRARRAARQAAGKLGGPALSFDEIEPAGVTEVNDLPLLAEPLAGLGTRAGESPTAEIRGRLRAPPDPLPPSVEPDDAIPLAHPVPLAAGAVVALAGSIGDGAHGSAGNGSGDYDLYALGGTAGQRLEIAVDTPEPLADLDPIVALYDAAGQFVDLNDNLPVSGFLTSLDSYLAISLPATGDYFVAVGGSNFGFGPDLEDQFPADPFTAGTGPGAGSEGDYELVLGLAAPDPRDEDWFALELRAGDVVGANLLAGARRLRLADPDGVLRVESPGVDPSGVYPAGSPLPGGGDGGALGYVADRDGTWALGVAAEASFDDAAYTVEVLLARPPLDLAPGPARQVLFVDFDGATLDAETFGGPPGTVTLSALRAFTGDWGLAGREDELIDRVLAVVEENLSADLRLAGGNGDFDASGHFGEFDIEIRNSRDHPDPFRRPEGGRPGVSRVIVGGSQTELGIPTIGIAQSIDPGNFATGESAVVLLDALSEPAGGPEPPPDSLNSIPRAPGAPIEGLVATALGNLVAHEAGHLLANFHTERDVGPPRLMDRGGRLEVLIGLGDDGVWGTADDLDVDFGRDDYSFVEGFRGSENTLQAISFGLPAAGPRGELATLPLALDFGALDPAASRSLPLAVSNEGTNPLAVAAATLAGPQAASYGVTAGVPPFTLAPGERRQLTVELTAGGLGPRTATLELASDDPARPTVGVPLSGQGGLPRITLAPTRHDFGDLVYGTAESQLTHPFSVGNRGGGELRIDALAFVGPDRAAFRVDSVAPVDGDGDGDGDGGKLPFTVPAGGSRQVTLAFRPGGPVGPMRATLSALGNDPATPRIDAALSGTAIGPDIDLDPGSPYFFGGERPGDERRRTFTVANLGSRDLTVGGAAFEGEHPGDFALTAGGPPFAVGPGGEHEMELAFRPTELGLRRATLVLANDDPDESPFRLELAGAGISPVVFLTPGEHDFGEAEVGGEPVRRFFFVINDGDAPLAVSATEIAGDDDDAFRIETGGAPFVLAPGGERTLRLLFEPSRPGTHQAVLAIDSDDPTTPRVEASIVGTGIGGGVVEIPTLSGVGLALLALGLAAIAWRIIRRRPLSPP